ncbi:MAG TPA: hypothetical protein DER67_04990 [Novosphingobium sp.]|nr:hypothetical protein [Novosphingobium sp.]
MIVSLVITFLAVVLIAGQTNVVVASLRKRRSGWFNFQFSREDQPSGFWAMMAIEVLLLIGLILYCASLIRRLFL